MTTLRELKESAEAALIRGEWSSVSPQDTLQLIALIEQMGEALEVAFSYDGDVFGIHHNDATDALAAYKEFGK
jgi:hypothetical protein